jgi:flagellar biosynthesis/type III secretory pathway ATPase
LINLGAYAAGSNPKLDAAIAVRERLLAFLRQDPSVNAPAGETLKRMEELAAAIPGGAS